MVLTYKTGTGGDLATYYAGSREVPELAAKLATYLGDAYAIDVAAGTAALPAMNMHPLIADLLKIDPGRSLTQEEVTNLLSGLRTDGEVIPGTEKRPASTKDRAHLTFTDFTFSAPKELSIAIALAGSEKERSVLEGAFMRANNALMSHIESEISGARQGDGGKKGIIPGHMAFVTFHHYTSRPTQREVDGTDTRIDLAPAGEMRPGDMQRHAHNLFAHVTITDDGDVKAPDLRTIKGRVHEWGAIGHAFLASELRKVGVRVAIDDKTGLSCLPDIPKAAVQTFSNRTTRAEVEARQRAAEGGRDFDTLTPQERASLLHGRAKAGRQAKEAMSELEFWHQTAADTGYVHKSVIDPANRQGLADPAARTKLAYEAALPMLEPELARRSKLDSSTIRTMAARGLIASGIGSVAEIENVIEAFMTEGVRQNGQTTSLLAGKEYGDKFFDATTALHVAEEREAIGILQAAASDKSAALATEQIESALVRVAAAKGYDFTNAHGLKQAALAKTLATTGRAAVAVGAAGVGKTTLLAPVIDAHHHDEWDSYGVTLAWRQTQGLKDAGVGTKGFRYTPDPSALIDAGINKDRAFAMAPFLNAVDKGTIKPTKKTLVVIDEIATIDTHQMLRLARAQRDHGFKIIGIGDDAQCRSINAGNTIRLFRLALGPDQVPELLDSIRQKNIEDRMTARFLREGKADIALARKDAAGLLTLPPGEYQDAIKAGVDWLERKQAQNADREDYTVGVSVPSNADVHAFGQEYRARQRAAGKLTGEDWTIDAIDQTCVHRELALTVGDRVRLYNRTNAALAHGKFGYFGENGTVVEVMSINKEHGLHLKRADGVVGAVRWSSIQDKDTGRIKLSYGSALTIDARQSETLDDHLTLLADGSHAIDRNKAYSAGTRARGEDMLIISHGAEKEEIKARRPMGDTWLEKAREPEVRAAIMANIARNLSRRDDKVLGVDFIDRGIEIHAGGVNTQHAAWFRSPQPEPHPSDNTTTTKAYRSAVTSAPAKILMAPSRHEVHRQVRQEKRSVRPAAQRPKRHQTAKPAPSAHEVRAEFAEALRRSGLRLPQAPVMDGKWHRAAVEGDKGRKMSARYRGYLDDRPAGFIENFKTGEANTWRAETPAPMMTPAERQRIEADRMARESARRAAEEHAAARALGIWSNARPVTQHAYLERKDIAAHELRQDRHGNLVLPVRDVHGTIHNIQMISPDGDKLFVRDGRKHGLFAQIGIIEPDKPFLIAEGYATAASLHQATGLPVVIAFDASNLQLVAQALRTKYPDATIVIAANNDHHLPRRDHPLANIGLTKAEVAARAVAGVVVAPTFGAVERQPLVEGKSPPTDWNDYQALHGKVALKETAEAAMRAQGVPLIKGPSAKTKTTQAMRDAVRRTHAATRPNEATAHVHRQNQTPSLRKGPRL